MDIILPAWKSAWEVLSLFLIPIGGGIPAGVLLAKTHGFGWLTTSTLYLISDIILACLFEPLMHLAVIAGKRSPFVARITAVLKQSVKKTSTHFGSALGPLALITLAFGVDPMTGRAAAAAAGHGFITGWILAISGDMIYFALIMVSTLFLNNILGDGTWTTLIIMALMMIVPSLVKKWRLKKEPVKL